MSAALVFGAVLLMSPSVVPRLRQICTGSEHRGALLARIAAWACALVFVPLPWSLAAGWVAASILSWALLRVQPRRPENVGDLAVALGLMASCLRAGASPARAAQTLGTCLSDPIASAMARAARALYSGTDPAAAWDAVLATGGEAASIAQSSLRRSLVSGSGLAEALERTADHIQRSASVDMQARLQASTVRVVLPLALCFLPAFALVGVVPIVAGIATGLL